MIDDTNTNAASKATDGTARMADTVHDATAQFGDKLRNAGSTMKQTTEHMAETGTALGMKMLDQAESNAREAFAAMRAAAQAKDISDVVKIQGDYLRDQTNRAVSQAREIAELITMFGRDTMTQMTRK